MDTILASVARVPDVASSCTRRPSTGGFGGEIAAQLADRGLVDLLAPVRSVSPAMTRSCPCRKLEDRYMPSAERASVAAARQSALEFA